MLGQVVGGGCRFVNKYLKIMGRSKPDEKDYRRLFVEEYLRMDGVLVLWLIAKNVTDLTVGMSVSHANSTPR